MKNSPAKWVVKTALFLAILIALQAATAGLGNTLITGSLVNLTLVLTVMLAGVSSGVTVAVFSPLVAFLLGVGPKLLPIIPCIMVGNVVLVLIWHWVTQKIQLSNLIANLSATILAAVLKFAVLYLLVVKLVVNVILALPAPQSVTLSTMFSLPQLITALVGGLIATLLLPILQPLAQKHDWV